MSTITQFTTITNAVSSTTTSTGTTSTTSVDPYIQSLLPKCEGPPYNSQPSIAGIDEIPKNINVAMVGGSDITFPAMVSCCYPNHVQLYNGCYLWCKIPEPREGEVDNLGQPKKKLENWDDVFSNFTQCLRADPSWDVKIHKSVQGQQSGASGMASAVGLGGLMMGLLVATSLVLV
ncbi:hypothetical protein V8F20_004813 [Naviculisporaceae sp. PSN 640]